MILNFDRRRIYILGSVVVLLALFLGFYHAPTYEAEISRMKTSVSTWLKGTEPSLSDETYKDDFQFNAPNIPHTVETKPVEHSSSTESVEYTQTFAQDDVAALPLAPIVGDDVVDMLPPGTAVVSSSVAISTPATTSASKELPAQNDFINILPPVNVLSGATGADFAMSTPQASATDTPFAMSTPQIKPTDAGSATSIPQASATAALSEVTAPAPTTMATHVSPSAVEPSQHAPGKAPSAEKWWLDEEE